MNSTHISHDNCPRRLQHEFHVIRVRGARHVNERVVEIVIDQAILKLLNKVYYPMVEIFGGSSIIAERPLSGNVAVHDLFREYILLIQEEHDGSIRERAVVADRSEQLEGLDHAVGPLGLGEVLVVLRQGRDEDDGRDGIEAVDPLSPFRSLTPHVVHLEVDPVDAILLHDHLRGANARDQHVLGGGLVVRGGYAGDVVEVLLVGVDDVDGRAFCPYLFYCYGLRVFVTEIGRRNGRRLWHIFDVRMERIAGIGEGGRGGGGGTALKIQRKHSLDPDLECTSPPESSHHL